MPSPKLVPVVLIPKERGALEALLRRRKPSLALRADRAGLRARRARAFPRRVVRSRTGPRSCVCALAAS